MPGPPPPPPPGPPAPPAPPSAAAFKPAKSGAGDGRDMLLQSIRQGAKLKKTTTVDKSAPLIPGKVTSSDSSSGSGAVGNGVGLRGPQNGGPMGLGGLFAQGMPKLKPVGSKAGNQNAKINKKPEIQLSSEKIQSAATDPGLNRPMNHSVKKFEPHVKNLTLPKKFNASKSIVDTRAAPLSPGLSQGKGVGGGDVGSVVVVKTKFTPNVHAADVDRSRPHKKIHQQTSVNQFTQLLNQTLAGGVTGAPKSEQQKKPHGTPVPNRAPPPQPPPPPQPSTTKIGTQNQQEAATNPIVLQRINSTNQTDESKNIVPNVSNLHRNSVKAHETTHLKISEPGSTWNAALDANYGGSMPSLVQSNSGSVTPNETENSAGNRISYGKPNVAPKPPNIQTSNTSSSGPQSPKLLNANGRPVSRAQSFKGIRSPPTTPTLENLPPAIMMNNGFSTLRPSKISQSQETVNKRPLPLAPKINAPQPPGLRMPSRAPLRPPMHCPPPPPSRPVNLPPPPPPPHRHPVPPVSNSDPPQPPVRGSSMRNSEKDLDVRFADRFRPVTQFPYPDAFLRTEKSYASASTVQATNTNVNKQHAPPPPPMTHIQLGNKLWADNSTAC